MPPADPFDRFTERARNALVLAQDEAKRFNHNYIGTEHLLLGLTRQGEGIAAEALSRLEVKLDTVRTAVEFIIGRGERQVLGEIGLTPRAKKVIELAVDEARKLDHHHVGTEHLLLGLIREGEGIAAGVLESLGVSLDHARQAVLQTITEPGAELRGTATEDSAQGWPESAWGEMQAAPWSLSHPFRPAGRPPGEYTYLRVTRSAAGLPVVAEPTKGQPDLPAISPGTGILEAIERLSEEGWTLMGIDSGSNDGVSIYIFRR